MKGRISGVERGRAREGVALLLSEWMVNKIVVGKYGVPGENESGERLLDMCLEQELVIGNSFFQEEGCK